MGTLLDQTVVRWCRGTQLLCLVWSGLVIAFLYGLLVVTLGLLSLGSGCHRGLRWVGVLAV
jgi:hypothetical protein